MTNEISLKQTVLIASEATEDTIILEEILRADYNIQVATDGEATLKAARSDNPPDLILLDAMMPELDGRQACQALKSDPRTENIPVILITAKNSADDEMKGFELGAVDYIIKPFRPVVVSARVRTHAELKKYHDNLKNASYCDGLTGIANRSRFDEFLATAWNFAIRQVSPVSLIMIDIDHFRSLNDNYGYQPGDACLRRIAQTLSQAVKRKTDLVARLGGDEFACVLPGATLEGSLQVALNFQTNVLAQQIPHAFSSAGNFVTISQGVATGIPTHKLTAEVLIRAASDALYKAKQSGRNAVCHQSALLQEPALLAQSLRK